MHVKLTDFGIAKLLDAQGVTSTGQVLGSPAHMAPEQIEGGEVDARADVFGLGVLLYECMVGHLPFEGKEPRTRCAGRVLEGTYPSAEREQPKVGKRWSAILDRALARLPEGRATTVRWRCRRRSSASLKLLGVNSSRAELEARFDDPAAYAATAAPRADRELALCEPRARRTERWEPASKPRRASTGALAYSPHDPALLKIVATIFDRARAPHARISRSASFRSSSCPPRWGRARST